MAEATTEARAGRKPLGERKRRGKEVSLTPAAWRWLEWYRDHVGVGTVSQAVELLARSHEDWRNEAPDGE